MTDDPAVTAATFREGDCVLLPPFSGPGAVWFRITRGWINGYGSEVTSPWIGEQDAVLIARVLGSVTPDAV